MALTDPIIMGGKCSLDRVPSLYLFDNTHSSAGSQSGSGYKSAGITTKR